MYFQHKDFVNGISAHEEIFFLLKDILFGLQCDIGDHVIMIKGWMELLLKD